MYNSMQYICPICGSVYTAYLVFRMCSKLPIQPSASYIGKTVVIDQEGVLLIGDVESECYKPSWFKDTENFAHVRCLTIRLRGNPRDFNETIEVPASSVIQGVNYRDDLPNKDLIGTVVELPEFIRNTIGCMSEFCLIVSVALTDDDFDEPVCHMVFRNKSGQPNTITVPISELKFQTVLSVSSRWVLK